MRFSLEWLLETCPLREDARRIAEALTARGLTVDAIERQGDDHVLDVDVPANRPDCLGHLGLAREMGAAFGAPPSPRQLAPPGGPADVLVEIDDPAECPRYTARVIGGVRVGRSPDWVVRRLEHCGLRSVNNVVDASNLVLLGLGHPIHFFDLDELESRSAGRAPTIRVRQAHQGERLKTLDGVERGLRPEDLVVADAQRAIALAGIMGGADSEIGAQTRRVLCEAAVFRPLSVRSSARRLGLRTEASYRFERGVDPEAPIAAQALAARLLAELAGGEPSPGWTDVEAPREPRRTVLLRGARVLRLLGFEPSREALRASLEALGLACDPTPEGFEVTIPSWRLDLEREADLVEEVARHLGYDRIPIMLAQDESSASEDHASPSPEERARDLLGARGFHEALGYAMIAAGEDDALVLEPALPPLVLTNPIAENLACLRRSILPGLLRAADLNFRRGTRDVRLFEVGKVFLPAAAGGFPDEAARIGLLWSGAAEPRHFSRPARDVDHYDVTGIVEHVVLGLALVQGFTRGPGGPRGLHPGRSATWRDAAGRAVAWSGALHPELQRPLDHEVFVAEIELDRLSRGSSSPTYQPLPRFPAVSRDLSFVAPRALAWERVSDVLRSVEAPAPATLEAVDRYEGPPLAPQEVSLTVRFVLLPRERTLTDEETEEYRRKLIERLERDLGARIRG